MGATILDVFRAEHPRVTYNSLDNQYLVVWCGDDNVGGLVDNEFEIFGQRLDGSDATEIGEDDFRISRAGGTGNTSSDACFPDVTYATRSNGYLVVWTGDPGDGTADDEFEIFAQPLGAQGSPVGPTERVTQFGADGDPDFDAAQPALSYNAMDESYLITATADDDVLPLVDEEFEVYGQSFVTTCGNGIREGLEACDDGFTDACGLCNEDCTGVGGGPCPCAFIPADLHSPFFDIEADEMSLYATCFLTACLDWAGGGPSPPSASFVSRAGTLFVRGNFLQPDYCCDRLQPAPLLWVEPGQCNPPVAAVANVEPVEAPDVNSARRVVRPHRASVEIRIRILPPPDSSAYAIEERLPSGVAVIDVSHGGLYHADLGSIRWGPFLDNAPRDLTYRLNNVNARSVTESLDGVVSFDGRDVSIAGAATGTRRGRKFGERFPGRATPGGRLNVTRE